MSFVKGCDTCKRIYRTQTDFFTKTSAWRLCSQNNVWFNCSCGSTLMIARENCPWFSLEAVLKGHNWSIFKKITEKQKLPHVPYQVMQVLQVIQDEKVSSKQIAGMVRSDPMLASKILSVANNLKVAGGGQLDSLEHAISFIGYKMLKDTIVTAALSAIKLNTKQYKQDRFWKDALLTGYIADTLCRWTKTDVPSDLAYICGALCNIGKLVLAICEPRLADEVYLTTLDPKKPQSWQKGEAHAQAPSHTTVGEIGAIFWGLPEPVILSAGYHHDHNMQMDGEASSHRNLINIVKFANQLVHWVNLSPFEQDEQLLDNCKKYFNVSERSLDDYVKTVMSVQHKLKA
ncbi:MAG: HDOD domain-containing protein [Oligoflexales bacterium]